MPRETKVRDFKLVSLVSVVAKESIKKALERVRFGRGDPWNIIPAGFESLSPMTLSSVTELPSQEMLMWGVGGIWHKSP